jgi:two-component system, LytTR family, response regulator
VISRVLIADDEPLARERLRELLRAHAPAAELREVGDGAAAVAAIAEWAPEAVFLDIQMPRGDGFAVVEQVGPGTMPPTCFVTAYDAHALRAFEVAAVDYVLKPYDDARFAAAWARLQRVHVSRTLAEEAQRFSLLLSAVSGALPSAAAAGPGDGPAGGSPAGGRYAERLVVRVGERSVPVPVQEIRWLQSDGNYVDLFTGGGKHTLRETLQELERRLDPARFVRIHRRVIVAIDHIKELQPWFAGDQVLILRDGTKLRVSRTRREALLARIEGRG